MKLKVEQTEVSDSPPGHEAQVCMRSVISPVRRDVSCRQESLHTGVPIAGKVVIICSSAGDRGNPRRIWRKWQRSDIRQKRNE